MGVALRERRPGDLPRLVEVLQVTHEQVGYPVRDEAVSASWLARPDELGSWVAVSGGVVGRVVGHVALHPAGGRCLPAWEAGAGVPAARLAVVSRLYTDGSTRGAGTLLLDTAVGAAQARGLAAVLEVEETSAALGFYLRRGWREAGRVPQVWGEHHVVVAALVAPAV